MLRRRQFVQNKKQSRARCVRSGQSGTRAWILAAIAITALSLAIVFGAESAAATEQVQSDVNQHKVVRSRNAGPHFLAPRFNPDAQIFNEDLKVEEGQTILEDVTVLNGDAKIESGGTVGGSLIVLSGDVKIEDGATVRGDITLVSGDAEINGTVRGNVSVASGDIELKDSAVVSGDVSVLSGDIKRDQNAIVRGQVLSGPDISFPGFLSGLAGAPIDEQVEQAIDDAVSEAEQAADEALNNAGEARDRAVNRAAAEAERAAERAAEQATSAQRYRPSAGERIGQFILRLLGAGLVTLLIVAGAGILMTVRPQYVTNVRNALRRDNKELALNAIVGLITNFSLVALISILAITCCLLPVAIVPFAVLAGLNLVSWAAIASRFGERIAQRLNLAVSPAATVAVGALAITVPIAFLWALSSCTQTLASIGVLIACAPGVGSIVLPFVRRLSSGRSSTSHPSAPAAPYAGSSSPPAATPAESAPPAAPPDAPSAVTSAEADVLEVEPFVNATAADDFTQIRGLGPVAGQRLRDAGISTFSQLAAMSAAAVGEVLGWSEARVLRNEIIEQAQAFSAG